MHIHATEEQLKMLLESKNPVQIDGILSEVLSQTHFGTVQLVKEYTVDITAEIWKNIPPLPTISFQTLPQSKSVLINSSILLVLYLLCRRYNISYFVVLAFAAFYFLYEYLDYECHKVR